MSAPEPFRGLSCNEALSTDHFFRDQLRWICDEIAPDAQTLLNLTEFSERLLDDSEDAPFVHIREFLFGLQPQEPRLRWDRLVALHLLVIAFLAAFGYKTHRASDEELRAVAEKFVRPEVRRNLAAALTRLGLDGQAEVKRLAHVIEQQNLPTLGRGPS